MFDLDEVLLIDLFRDKPFEKTTELVKKFFGKEIPNLTPSEYNSVKKALVKVFPYEMFALGHEILLKGVDINDKK